MATSHEFSIESFFEQFSTLIADGERQLHTDNLNISEFICRRLEDAIHVINVLAGQCEDIVDLHRLISTLLDRARRLHEHFASINDQLGAPEPDLICGIVGTGRAGRPRLDLPQKSLDGLYAIHRSWTLVGSLSGKHITLIIIGP